MQTPADTLRRSNRPNPGCTCLVLLLLLLKVPPALAPSLSGTTFLFEMQKGPKAFGFTMGDRLYYVKLAGEGGSILPKPVRLCHVTKLPHWEAMVPSTFPPKHLSSFHPKDLPP